MMRDDSAVMLGIVINETVCHNCCYYLPYSGEQSHGHDFITQMEPCRRLSAKLAMKHEYFRDLPPKIHDLPDGTCPAWPQYRFSYN